MWFAVKDGSEATHVQHGSRGFSRESTRKHIDIKPNGGIALTSWKVAISGKYYLKNNLRSVKDAPVSELIRIFDCLV